MFGILILQGRRQDFHGGVSEEACAKHAYWLLRTIATIYWQVFRENDRKIIEILQFYGS